MKYLKFFENFNEGENYEEEMCPECDCKVSECKCPAYEEETYESKKSKPDFLDLDKDGNKKESMKKAAADKKKSESGKKTGKGTQLTAAQKKLPKALQKAILKK